MNPTRWLNSNNKVTKKRKIVRKSKNHLINTSISDLSLSLSSSFPTPSQFIKAHPILSSQSFSLLAGPEPPRGHHLRDFAWWMEIARIISTLNRIHVILLSLTKSSTPSSSSSSITQEFNYHTRVGRTSCRGRKHTENGLLRLNQVALTWIRTLFLFVFILMRVPLMDC